MPGNGSKWRALLVVLFVAAMLWVLPVAAQNETPPEPPTITLTEVPSETLTESPGETLTEESTETTSESPTIQEQAVEQVTPGDTIQVSNDPQFYDFSALRNDTPPAGANESLPVTELQSYENDNIENGTIVSTVSLGDTDTSVELQASDFNGVFGTYYPYDGETVIDKPITVESSGGTLAVNATENATATQTTGEPTMTAEVPTTEAATQTPLVETSTLEMPTFTPIETAGTPSPTPLPFSPITVLGALALVAIVVASRMKRG
jgi:hypothetical protein